MSNHTKAWALAREVPDDELRTELILANERIFDAAEDLADEDDEPGDLEAGVYNAITWRDNVRGIADKLDCGTDDIEGVIEDLQERPEPEPEKEADGTPTGDLLSRTQGRLEMALRRIEELETEREQFCQRVVELEEAKARAGHIPDNIRHAVGDVLAMSRKLATFCEAAGIKPGTLRVTHSRKKAS